MMCLTSVPGPSFEEGWKERFYFDDSSVIFRIFLTYELEYVRVKESTKGLLNKMKSIPVCFEEQT